MSTICQLRPNNTWSSSIRAVQIGVFDVDIGSGSRVNFLPSLLTWHHLNKRRASEQNKVIIGGDFRACAYYDEFEKPKITWGNLAQTPKFTMDIKGHYINAPSVINPEEDYYLLGILNSSLFL